MNIVMKLLYWLTLLTWSEGVLQINLYDTEQTTTSDDVWQRDCIRLVIPGPEEGISRQSISYCMSESIAVVHEDNDVGGSKLTFAGLAEQNITSEELYEWSASIDLIERYQIYLDNLPVPSSEVFYNCTLPRFGPTCQYQFVTDHHNQTSLHEIILDFYRNHKYTPTELTCYTHLQCNRGPSPACLDWSEICDGKVNCLDGDFDEEHCWQLDLNRCNESEFQCYNGQCIPREFLHDDPHNPDCLDRSDEVWRYSNKTHIKCDIHPPTFGCDEVTCGLTPLTSSCVEHRRELLKEAMYAVQDTGVNDTCWSAFKCLLDVPDPAYPFYDPDIAETTCQDLTLAHCPDMFHAPSIPVLFGRIFTAYTRADTAYLGEWARRSPYLCYNNSRYDDYMQMSTKVLYHGSPCYRPKPTIQDRPIPLSWEEKYHLYLYRLFYSMEKLGRVSNSTAATCQRENVYRCWNSTECIPEYRIMDGYDDCPHRDDENIFTSGFTSDALERIKKDYYKCQYSEKYIHRSSITDGRCDCGYTYFLLCEDENTDYLSSRRTISFRTICDGFVNLSPLYFRETNQTDETECEQWFCANIYTRCDGLWNCPNGEDEIGCDSTSPLPCSMDHHVCVSPTTYEFICLPIEKADDGHVDCLGGTDERTLCTEQGDFTTTAKFYCRNHSSYICIPAELVCNNEANCEDGDDESFCVKNHTFASVTRACRFDFDRYPLSAIERFLCDFLQEKEARYVKHFTIDGLRPTIKRSIFNPPIIVRPPQRQRHCHRGLDLRVWLNSSSSRITCLCPPSYYGSRCQYQNQRIGLSLRFRASTDSWQTLFAIVVSLTDGRLIHSSEQLTYLSVRDCQTKFQVYLLYANRSKDVTRNYSVHIDFFEKSSLAYRGRVLLPIDFPFLPVHRLAFIVDIPQRNNQPQACTGSHCQCSSDSTCLAETTANNRSICVCPLHKFGPQCRLINTLCQGQCLNNGTCVPNDESMVGNSKFTCLCAKGYSGDRCEVSDSRLNISFAKDITPPQSIFIHLIEVRDKQLPVRSTLLRTLSGVQDDTTTIYWPRPFHLAFVEIPTQTYYLAARSTITPSARCPHIRELLNASIVQSHLLHRIKYYQVPCQDRKVNLSCFYDEEHLCLCNDYGRRRHANCFDFDHHMKYDCFGRSDCEHGGQCFQDSPDCPKRFICVCRPCYYGRRCQFTTSGFGLSLDAILGYHIQPGARLVQQSFIVKFSLTFTLLFLLAGLIDGVLCMITFSKKTPREVGCGYYLVGSSVTTLLTMITFALKFIILLLAQMAIISNRSFLLVQCRSMDFLLRVSLYMDQWLNACVAIERSVMVVKGTSFSRLRSRQAAKGVIISLVIVILASSTHDPIARRLIDEEKNDSDEEKRTWCTTNYSPTVQIYDSVLTTFHFFAPFIINLLSAIVLIVTKSRQRSNITSERSYKKVIKKHVQEHRHLLTAPVVLVVLAIPRLVVSYTSKCMNSLNESWIFLFGYFVSLIPPMLTFIVFVLPSKVYTNEFYKTYVAYRQSIERYFH